MRLIKQKRFSVSYTVGKYYLHYVIQFEYKYQVRDWLAENLSSSSNRDVHKCHVIIHDSYTGHEYNVEAFRSWYKEI